jgi:glycosyltransferase involved in cell wall biosynthesis
MVEHERSALLCEPGSVESLTEQVGRMLEDRALAQRAAAQGLRNVEERFHPDAVARRTIEFYRRVPGMNRGPARSPGSAGAVPLNRA